MSTDLTGLIPHGWTGGEAVTKWWRGKHLHLYRLRKNCAQCQKEMVLDVTKAAIVGTAKNAGLHLTRCTGCREASKTEGGTSRPRTAGEPIEAQLAAVHSAAPQEIEMYLRSIQTLQGQLTVAHDALKTLRVDYDKAMARLAKYELQPAMEQVVLIPSHFKQPGAAPAKPFDGHALLAAELADKNNSKKFPWGS